MYKNKGIYFKRVIILLALLGSFGYVYAQNAPIAVRDVNTADQDVTLTINAPGVLANDTDADGDALVVTRFTINGITFFNAGATANLAEGTITINADGSYTFVPTAGYSGTVPDIVYEISDGTSVALATLLLTVETTADLLSIELVSSCNQGYTANGDYKIRYDIRLMNMSIARDYHPSSLISNINLQDDLPAVFGNGCVTLVEINGISTTEPEDFVNNPYPQDWDTGSVNPNFLGVTSSNIFSAAEVTSNVLYPRQIVHVSFCVTVNPFCNGRPNPTPSGSGITFDNLITASSSRGNTSYLFNSVIDYHTSETTVAANFFINNVVSSISEPPVQPNGTYNFTNTIIITNDGTTTANNVNYNMGLGNFYDNGVTFSTLTITQVSGPTVNINPAFNGDAESLMLTNGNSLNAGEIVILEIHYIVNPLPSSNTRMLFSQLSESMTQGPDDSLSTFDETLPANKRRYSYVLWSDALGNHLDRYYTAATPTDTPSSNDQCQCDLLGMRLLYNFNLEAIKSSTVINAAPQGVVENEEISFQISITNKSNFLQVENIQLTDDLTGICGGNIVQVSNPVIISSTATTTPTLNAGYNGVTDTNIFDGVSGIIEPNQNVVIELKAIFKDDCIGNNIATFSASDPLGNNTGSVDSNEVAVSVFSDTDNDGITDINDIDDDNDGILDLVELNGLDPLLDDDNDGVPNYRDTDFGTDANNDGIVDIFDFDLDGVPNHFDLDSDNDGITDIIEGGGIDDDANGRVPINADGTLVVDADGDGLTDDFVIDTTGDGIADQAVDVDVAGGILMPLPNTDATGNPDYLDIDSDNDGIVDIIEAQTSAGYNAPNPVNTDGLIFTTGLAPIDTDGDNTPDYLDLDTDNDGVSDAIEGWDFTNDGVPETTIQNTDTDNDGLDNAYDVDDTQINPTNAQTPTDFPNVDNADTAELDWRELEAIVVVIDDVEVVEGGNLVFTISLTKYRDNTILNAINTDVVMNIFTTDGTTTTTQYEIATAPFDYDEIPNTPTTITIPAGDTTFTVTIPTTDDTIYELIEYMTLNGEITSGNTINTVETGIGKIRDNDNAPNITMNDSRAVEGNDLIHTITLSNPSSTPVIIDITTVDVTAISPEDYAEFIHTLTIDGTVDQNNANLTTTFNIATVIDGLNEVDEEYIEVNGVVTTANVGIEDLNKEGVIVDLEPPPAVSIDNITVTEGEVLHFTISIDIMHFEDISLNIFTSNVTARAPEDYLELITQVTIPPYSTSVTVDVITNDDNLTEDIETLEINGIVTTFNTVNLNPVGVGTILDNDTPNLFSPNDDGISDVFEVISLYAYPNFKMQIFDRWGSQVYDYKNEGRTQPIWWNGNWHNNPVPEGVYYYTIDYNDGKSKPKSGFIQLIR